MFRCQFVPTAAHTVRNKRNREGIVVTLKTTYLLGFPCEGAATWPFLCSAVPKGICYKKRHNMCNTAVIFKTAQYQLEEVSLQHV